MPELPEVEVTRQGLIPLLKKTISKVDVRNYSLRWPIDNDLEIIPVINKVDLPNADIENVTSQIIELVGCSKDDILLASAKTGEGIEDILTTIIDKIPPPDEPKNEEFKGLIFDSIYDRYRGGGAYVRVYVGALKKGSRIKFFAHDTHYDVDEVGHFIIERKKAESIRFHSLISSSISSFCIRIPQFTFKEFLL